MIKRWLNNFADYVASRIEDRLKFRLNREFKILGDEIKAANAALGRILAKLEPENGLAEDDPIRRQVSDLLGNAIISRLKAEQAVRDQYHYNPEDQS